MTPIKRAFGCMTQVRGRSPPLFITAAPRQSLRTICSTTSLIEWERSLATEICPAISYIFMSQFIMWHGPVPARGSHVILFKPTQVAIQALAAQTSSYGIVPCLP
jgi:hypothetical protein